MKHVMLDLETLGTAADSVIVSIGAVRFDLNTIDDDAFYTAISIESNLALGRKVSGATLAWWMQQSDAARKVFNEPSIALDTALEELKDWFKGEDCQIWSNGAAFDIPMIEHAFAQLDQAPPWKFWNARCFRTMKGLPLAKKIPPVKASVAHNALADALAQAQTLQAIWNSDGKKLYG